VHPLSVVSTFLFTDIEGSTRLWQQGRGANERRAGLALGQGDLAAAKGHLEEAVAAARAANNQRQVASALSMLAEVHQTQRELDTAERLYREALFAAPLRAAPKRADWSRARPMRRFSSPGSSAHGRRSRRRHSPTPSGPAERSTGRRSRAPVPGSRAAPGTATPTPHAVEANDARAGSAR
jgi:tetratricopeptide (TPR) repeat protein